MPLQYESLWSVWLFQAGPITLQSSDVEVALVEHCCCLDLQKSQLSSNGNLHWDLHGPWALETYKRGFAVSEVILMQVIFIDNTSDFENIATLSGG